MIDLSIIIVYFIGLLFIGWRSRRQTVESYWVAGRNFGTLRITSSMVATVFGASSTIGIIGIGYSRGLTAVWWLLIGAFFLIILGILLAGKIRKLGVYTLPDILHEAYGPKAEIPVGLMISIAWCGIIAAQIYASGLLLSTLFSIDMDLALTVSAAILILYTFWGGQLSVIKTDYGQLILFIGSLLIVLIALLIKGSGDGSMAVPDTHFLFPVSPSFGYYDMLVFYPLIIGLPYLAGPDIYSRIFCAKDGRVAKRATLVSAALIVPLAFMLAILGIAIRAYAPGIDPASALPIALAELIPTGLKGLLAAGFLGAIMSSADSCLISVGTILTRNLFHPLYPLKKGMKMNQLTLTRLLVIIVGLCGLMIAIWQRGIISSLLLGYTVFVGGVVLPTLMAFMPRKYRLSPNVAVSVVLTGGILALLGKISDGIAIRFIIGESGQSFALKFLGDQYLSILPLAVSAIIIVLSLLIKKRVR